MKVAILCGGRGMRIREVSDLVPKPMVPIGERPILWHIMKIFGAHGFNEFVLLLGHKGDAIREFFLNFSLHSADVTIDLNRTDEKRLTIHSPVHEPWKVTLVATGEDTMTGARLMRARRFLDDAPTFLATYGDGVGNVDIKKLVEFHRQHGRVATVTGVEPPSRYGELTVDAGRIKRFNEKPQVGGGHINGGFFVFQRELFSQYLNDREDLVLEKEPMEKLAQEGELMMYQHDGFWQPMDTPREYQLLNELWARGKAPWKVW